MPALWSQDKFIRAYNFAAQAHDGQCLPDSDTPYLYHVSLVCMEVMALLSVEPQYNPDLALQFAALHDVVEDTSITIKEIQEKFGSEVAGGVDALTKHKADPDAMENSLARIMQQPAEIWIVKLADRITNLQPPPSGWGHEKIKGYLAESEVIYQELQGASPYLAARLAAKIDHYRAAHVEKSP